ncbi:hypothetical protein Rhe02_88720 [Rhizocola hellebori]|uniref:Uncharacterized protein n=1 Tax=Rhizocola hellebori TaxID=1392758 RepID=A0A8J3QJC0_9ACTN|nr:hypothetical protein [Rhizocola hellebori]GIH10805.1 hypothetical protein Rhe02_88720 [Rhizocola hellebori]
MSRILAVLIALTLGSVVAAAPASAATCATNGHVYYNPYPLYIKYEFDPVDGTPYEFFKGPFPSGSTFHVRLGGNGLKPGTALIWRLYDKDGVNFRNFGIFVRSNCVAQEQTFEISAEPGTIVTFKANYDAGNTGAQIRDQNHFRIVFPRFG